MEHLYLNHAASSFPKPASVVEAVCKILTEPAGDASRGGRGADPRGACRKVLARLFDVTDADRVVLLPSATHAINLVIHGLVNRGDHVVSTVLEHNSVLRPLAHRSRELGIAVEYVEPGVDGSLNPADIEASLRPSTSLIVLTHASNVSGAIQPVETIADVAARHGIPLLIDAAQSGGIVPLSHRELPGRVFIAFAGHKGLHGPQGVGGLVLPDAELAQLIVGGTGIRSESPMHPDTLPLRHEAGTPNLPGIAGLLAGVQELVARDATDEGRNRHHLVREARRALGELPRIHLFPLAGNDGRAGILTFTVEGWRSEDISFFLSETFNIHTRGGLHCAPLAHRFFGTFPEGAVRASFGGDTPIESVHALTEAVAALKDG